MYDLAHKRRLRRSVEDIGLNLAQSVLSTPNAPLSTTHICLPASASGMIAFKCDSLSHWPFLFFMSMSTRHVCVTVCIMKTR